MYSVDAYGRMITDVERVASYVKALRQTVKPGSVVIDLGCGPGLFAMVACELGARRVFAIEPDGVIQLARESAKLNGFSDRIEFIEDHSRQVNLPEQADVLVADLRGILPFFQTNLPSLQDAKNRFLAPDGILIPHLDHLRVALVQSPEYYRSLGAPWSTHHGVSLASARKFALNSLTKKRHAASDLLCEAVTCHTIDYHNIAGFDLSADVSLKVATCGTAHGVSAWFDSELCDGVSMSNAPDREELIYGQAFFPLLEPIKVNEGDEARVRLRADLIKDDYVWTWETRFFQQDNPQTARAHFKQSTLFATPLAAALLHKRATSYTPRPNDEARLNSFVVSLMNGRTTVEQLSQRVSENFPERFPSPADALDTVADIAVRFGD